MSRRRTWPTANQLSADESLAGIEALVVPVPPQAEPSARARLYTVRRGDTLVTIADRFGVSLAQLRRWNAFRPGSGWNGQRLHVAEPVMRRDRAERHTEHRKYAEKAARRRG